MVTFYQEMHLTPTLYVIQKAANMLMHKTGAVGLDGVIQEETQTLSRADAARASIAEKREREAEREAKEAEAEFANMESKMEQDLREHIEESLRLKVRRRRRKEEG